MSLRVWKAREDTPAEKRSDYRASITTPRPDANPAKPPRMRRLDHADRVAILKLRFRPRTLTVDDAVRIIERIGTAGAMKAFDRLTQPSLLAAE